MIKISEPIIDGNEIAAVNEVLKSGTLSQGPKTKHFEENFAHYIGCKHAIATNSGTSALHTLMLASNVGKGDEVITTPLSFIASSNCILYVGAKPVFADISEDDFTIDPAKIEEKINSKTKAVLIVHLYGQPCNMRSIAKICSGNNLLLVEDACQSHGAEYNGKKTGSFGNGCFSFYPTKNMTTGEGGMITTDDNAVDERARMIISHGSKQRYCHKMLGYNYRMTDIAASIGIEQLKKLDINNGKRISNAAHLTKNLKGIRGIVLPRTFPERKHVFHQYTIRVTGEFQISRDDLVNKLKENGIETGIYYPTPIHKQESYSSIDNIGNFPISEKMAKEVISLPVHPALKSEDLEKIAEVIRNV